MALTFADTRNMIAYLTKSDESEGFDQIIDFLNASSIKYALTVNPNIYVSCLKQFWSSVLVKNVNDVTKLQALVDRKKVIITKAIVQETLRLDDAKSIDCLPNEEMFTELSRMGYEKPSTKLTFYKAFFSPQWKFFIHTILQCMSATRKSWHEFSSSIASAVICLSTGAAGADVADEGAAGVDVADEGVAGVDVDVVPAAADEPSLPSPTPTTQPPPPSQELPSTSQVIPTPPPSLLAQPSSPPQQQPSQPTHDAEISMDLLHTLLETCTTLTRKVEALEQDKRLKKVGTTQRVESSGDTFIDDVSKQGDIIVNMDADKDVTLKDVAVVVKEVEVEKHAEIEENDDELEPVELKEVVEVVTIAKLMT
nr:hypothetical protein [Tanacetum cinerariifolium]